MQNQTPSISDNDVFFMTLLEKGRQQAQRQACMSHEERLRDYLQRCNRRGSQYLPGIDSDPNLTQIAKYCECDSTTILRIANGETKAPSSQVISIISAVAGISPPAFRCAPGSDVDVDAERRARLEDADRWVRAGEGARGGALDAIMAGISARISAAMN